MKKLPIWTLPPQLRALRPKGVYNRGNMDCKKKKVGRPPKNGVKEPRQFSRALLVIDAYRKFRELGEKRIAAIRETVEAIRRSNPELPISETEVKRVLAEFQPQKCPTALRVEYSVLQGDEAAQKRRCMAEKLESAGIKRPVELKDDDLCKPLKRWRIGFSPRPTYPRHNGKPL